MYYYPTKIGTMHPNLEFDLFGEQMKACRENGIRAVSYTCVAWNEGWADRHPEWLTINAHGVRGTQKPFETAFCREFYQYIKAMDSSLDVYFNSFPYELDDGENQEASSVEKENISTLWTLNRYRVISGDIHIFQWRRII